MNLTYTLAFIAIVASTYAKPAQQDTIKGQYLISIDIKKFQTTGQVQDLADSLENLYNIYFVKSFDLKYAKFLFVKGEHDNVMMAKKVSGVKYIQQNMIHGISQSCQEQSAPGCWGLERIGQHETLSYTDPQNSEAQYEYGEDEGNGVVVYVADTGIDHIHSNFGGRASHGYTAGSIPNDEDGNGHGTHCAGTVGSDSYGVAKEASLVAVKVLRDSGFGSSTGIIDGIEWVVADHERRSENGQTAKSVLSMSLGGSVDDAMDDAVQAAIDAGVITVVAAGNFNADACNYSPARTPEAITVGASSVDDSLWGSSNYGQCVDIYAPGDEVLSTLPGESTAYFSGTSMATPHVAGVAARYIGSLSVAPSQAEVDAWLKSSATKDALTFNPGQSGDNVLLYGPC